MDKAKWVLMPKLLTPTVNPGQSIKMELFLTGTGKILANKLYINYPTAIIDNKDAGEIVASIKAAQSKDTGEIIQPVSGKNFLQTFPCNDTGTTFFINKGYFLDIPKMDKPEGMLPMKMAESKWDNYPPILLKLNIDKKAPSGDYDIQIAFTYTTDSGVDIAKEVEKVHITSWTDRHGKTSIIIGIAVAILSAVAGILTLLL